MIIELSREKRDNAMNYACVTLLAIFFSLKLLAVAVSFTNDVISSDLHFGVTIQII